MRFYISKKKGFIINLITIFSILLIFISDDIVALKRLKLEKEKEGFPITSLREINTLLKAQHPNIVTVRVSIYQMIYFLYIYFLYIKFL